jgi:tRNA modification GTPase
MAATFDRGRLRYAGARVALVGRPNVGKSSLMNALVGRDRAIVTPIPGTTRDVLEASIVVDGSPLVIMDTAGLRDTADVVEALGVERTRHAADDARCVLAIFDGSAVLQAEDAYVAELARKPGAIAVVNKTDLTTKLSDGELRPLVGTAPIMRVSAVSQEGFGALTAAIAAAVFGGEDGGDDEVVLFRARHHDAVREAIAHLARAEGAIEDGAPLELVASDLHLAASALSSITGAITSEDVLDRVFADFCLGK